MGKLWEAEMDHSPLDVVAWHGRYAPYKYYLTKFNCINSVTFDHPDPSIFCVLLAPTAVDGMPNVEFGCIPPRWLVAEHTFRPPPYHRNIASEFMGLIRGQYIGKAKAEGFVPGSASLHNCMAGHGPDAEAFERGRDMELKPTFLDNTLAMHFESRLVVRPTKFALEGDLLERDYYKQWQSLKSISRATARRRRKRRKRWWARAIRERAAKRPAESGWLRYFTIKKTPKRYSSHTMKITVLDDYQNTVRTLPAFQKVARFDVEIWNDHVKDVDVLAERLKDTEALALIRERTPIQRPLLEKLEKLRIISQVSAFPHVDAEACTERGIIISSNMMPAEPSHATSELTWGLIIAAMRRIPQEIEALKAGKWQAYPIGDGLHGKTLGIAGYGRLGKVIAGIWPGVRDEGVGDFTSGVTGSRSGRRL